MKKRNYILIGIPILLFVPVFWLLLDIILTPGIPGEVILILVSIIILHFFVCLFIIKGLLKEIKETEKETEKEMAEEIKKK